MFQPTPSISSSKLSPKLHCDLTKVHVVTIYTYFHFQVISFIILIAQSDVFSNVKAFQETKEEEEYYMQ